MSGSKTATKLFLLLEEIQRTPAQRLTELAQQLDLSVPTCSRLLDSLMESGLVNKRDGRFELGPYCLTLGEAFRSNFNLSREAHPLLEHLVAASGETAHLGVLDGLACVYIDKVDSPHSIRMYSRIGRRSPLHSTGMGKALLSGSDPKLTDAVINAGLEPRTPHTITDPGEFRAEIARIRERGYSIDDVENEAGIRCVAAVILDHRGDAAAAVSVAGPDSRVTHEQVPTLATHVTEVAKALSGKV